MSYMFMSCSNLNKLDVSNFDFTNVIDATDIFYGVDESVIILPQI